MLKPIMRSVFAWLLLGLALAAPEMAAAGGGPENAVVVVNADSPESVTIAREYVRLRKIPPVNVVSLHGLPAGTTIKVEDFRQRILMPIMEAIRQRGLQGQIDYIVYSAGFPYAVDVSADMAGRRFPRFITQPASLTGLTYLCEMVLAKDSGYLALDANRYVRQPRAQKSDRPWSEEDKRRQAELEQLFAKVQEARRKAGQAKTPLTPEMQDWLEEAAVLSRDLAGNHPDNSELLYNLACVLALQQKSEEAMTSLTAAYKAGWWNANLCEADPDLASLRGRDDFKALMKKMRDAVIMMQPARAFHHATAWPDPPTPPASRGKGEPARPESGRRYYLSAMLAYTGGPANTLEEALDSLRKSCAADGSHPRGTIYYMVSGDWARTGPRQWAFRSAAEALKKLGVNAEVISGVLPKDKPDVAGAMIGTATFRWKESGSRILPGAFCDHLTSFGGLMTGAGQTLLSEFIRYGAAGACGTVTEPYNVPGKFPTAFLHVYYAGGCTLAEAFYQSVSGPYQQLLVGDPLCRPWAKIPEVHVKGLTAGQTIRRACRLTPASRSVLPVTRYELYVDGRLRQTCAPGKSLLLDPAGLPAGEHEARVVAVAGPLETRGRVLLPFRAVRR
jgi:hypothetical protein